MIYDVQGLGSRVDTAIKALNMVLNASAKSEIDLIILDRPNPLGGEILEGPIADTSYSSNFRIYPIPTRYGLTTAELSLMAVKEKMALYDTKNNHYTYGWMDTRYVF